MRFVILTIYGVELGKFGTKKPPGGIIWYGDPQLYTVDIGGLAQRCYFWFVFASVLFYQLIAGRLVKKTDANCTLQKPT